MGNITELVSLQKQPHCLCRKLDKDHYLNLRTGEVLEYEHIENRAGSAESIRKTLAYIRALINTNVTDANRVRWITLTYAENMTDTKRLYDDYFKFWKRFCYWCKKSGYEKPEYITVQEPQGRGAWHVHAFFIWSSAAPFIPNDTMRELWQQGFTKTKALQDCDNVGAYFSAYLGDMPLEEWQKLPENDRKTSLDDYAISIEEKRLTDDAGLHKDKMFVKGGRLCLYPPGMKIVRKTKGILAPVVEHMSLYEAKEKVCSAKQTFSRTFEVLSDDGKVINKISKAYYNSKRV